MNHHFPMETKLKILTVYSSVQFTVTNTKIEITQDHFLLTCESHIDYLMSPGPATIKIAGYSFEIDCWSITTDVASKDGYTGLRVVGRLFVPRAVTPLRHWTKEEVKEELPQVDCLWRGQRCAAKVMGRKLPHAIISLVNQPEIETIFSWDAVVRALNTGNLLRIW